MTGKGLVWAACCLVATALVACRPKETGPPGIADVENHLGLVVGYLPEDCEPVGLDGDGRGKMFGAAFDCSDGATLRIERFASGSLEGEFPSSPTESSPSSVDWSDPSTGDLIRVRSDEMASDILMRVAKSIRIED